jgi:hypothetical protein
MNWQSPNVASTPDLDAKYGLYICGRLNRENGTRSEIKLCAISEARLKNSGRHSF